ncbi:hypothetical protein N4844_16060, partial [Enterococcus faecalis]|uniref:hypothetical protein n=1 Tax=Enterococcus faecalis TaxID=1351 RepID=UPI0021E0C018
KKYDLIFELDFSPGRCTMPDIDIAIPDHWREEVLADVSQKYGHYHFAQYARFCTLAAEMVLRDVARVFGWYQSEENRWSEAVP